MTRDELVQALEVELGRPLTDDEAAFVDRTIEIRRGVIGTEDVIFLARDIRSKDTSASVEPTAAATSQGGQVPSVRIDPGGFKGDGVTEVGEVTNDDGFPPFPPFEAPGPRPIEVPLDFVASKEAPDALGATRPGDPTRTQTFEPRYFEGDERAPQSLDGTVIARLQKRLVAAGLLDEDEYYAGYWTEVSWLAYKTALGVANTNGTDVSKAIDELIRTLPQSIKDERDLDKFAEPPYLTPDYATLAQTVKKTMRDELGRDPTAGELAQLTREMSGFEREQFEVDTERERIIFEGGKETVTPPTLTFGQPLPEGQPPSLNLFGPRATPVGPQTLQDVDPEARFQELFEKRFKPEIDRLDSLGEVRRNTNNVFASLRTMSSLIGGR